MNSRATPRLSLPPQINRSLHILLTVILCACSSAGTTQIGPSATLTPPTTNEQTIEVVPSEAPTTDPTPHPGENCILCHTDKDRLIETADVEEVVEVESSGDG